MGRGHRPQQSSGNRIRLWGRHAVIAAPRVRLPSATVLWLSKICGCCTVSVTSTVFDATPATVDEIVTVAV